MTRETIDLARRLLGALPSDEVRDLVSILTYYNQFPEAERGTRLTTKIASARANAYDQPVEKAVVEHYSKTAGQRMYLSGPSKVCTCCGK